MLSMDCNINTLERYNILTYSNTMLAIYFYFHIIAIISKIKRKNETDLKIHVFKIGEKNEKHKKLDF
ncbi:hypothetical protein HNP90_001025 [Methanococcus maripaludis]|uniref:Uncharacterized protein n=1 Tax=Methanococcus maripaludis TaxID=39152 RepID=A0A7J9PHB5_METMI|nr:hypothetical protein [Methanococcus maripaludis]